MKSLEAFILAGGASSRMGRDKARLMLGGKSLVQAAAESLRQLEPQRVCIIGAEFEGLITLPDVWKSDAKGSIIGLHSALFHAQTEWVAVLACDLPFVAGELLKLLSLQSVDFDAVVPIQPDDKPQPLCAFYRRAVCLPIVEKMLESKEWALRKVLENVNTRFVEFDELKNFPNAQHFFFNVNTPEDYLQAQKLFNRH
jgi:molybdopterin-guanine dinucleotide biosynthesis protein A